MNVENFKEELTELAGTNVRVTTYKIGDDYHCHIYNLDPGATIARGSASNLEDAINKAMEKAAARLAATTKKT